MEPSDWLPNAPAAGALPKELWPNAELVVFCDRFDDPNTDGFVFWFPKGLVLEPPNGLEVVLEPNGFDALLVAPNGLEPNAPDCELAAREFPVRSSGDSMNGLILKLSFGVSYFCFAVN